MTQASVWHGTTEELVRLTNAVAEYCACQAVRRGACSAHAMLLDQHVLDRLLYVRRTVDAFIAAEYAR